jgi:signal transduction histidine kinase
MTDNPTNPAHQADIETLRARIKTLEQIAEAEHEQRTLAEALAETASILNSTLDLNEVLARILEQIGRVVPHDTANILLIDRETGALQIAIGPSYAEYGVESTSQTPRVSLSDTPTIRLMAESHQPLVIPNTEADPRWTDFNNHLKSGYQVKSYVGAPICSKSARCQPDNLIGFINCNSTQANFYTSVHAQQLEAFANQAAVAIENARLYDLAQQEIEERKRLNEELDAYAHTVAHDLKNPTTYILGYADLLESNWGELSEEDTRQALNYIVDSSQKACNIIDELLLLATVRKQIQIPCMTMDMPQIIAGVQIRLGSLVQEYRADIAIPETWPEAVGYAPWIEEVWVNYISNAIKYGDTPPQIKLGAERQPDNQIRFWVQDNGEGISPEKLKLLFVEFTRLETARAQGHGLGLSIVQRIIKRLGGKVGAESVVGEGSTFWFTLPVAG